jgi:hypothetical protein
MGGGDLNSKKTWHVAIMSSQRKVWDAEQKAIGERKVIQKIRQEREEERAVEELMRLQAESGQGSGNLINPKIAWMYQDSKAGLGGTSTELEGYLLGKRRVDRILLKQDEEKTEEKKETDMLGLGMPSARDITAKAAMDPLLAIEGQRQGNVQNMLQDPIMRRRLMKELAKEKDGEKSHKKHRRDDGERHHRSKRRRHSDEDDDDRREYRSHRSHRRRTSESRSRSRSPYSKRREEKHRSRRDSSHTLLPDDKPQISVTAGREITGAHAQDPHTAENAMRGTLDANAHRIPATAILAKKKMTTARASKTATRSPSPHHQIPKRKMPRERLNWQLCRRILMISRLRGVGGWRRWRLGMRRRR